MSPRVLVLCTTLLGALLGACGTAPGAPALDGGSDDSGDHPGDSGGDTGVPVMPSCAGDGAVALGSVVPLPASVRESTGSFCVTPDTVIEVDGAAPDAMRVAQYLADRLAPATGWTLAVRAASGAQPPQSIRLTTTGAPASLGAEGYALAISPSQITLTATAAAGLFYGVQTLRQLLPAAIEQASPQPGPWLVRAGTITDQPRFAWRGAMLDVARHFFGPDEVRRLIDVLVYYKVNRLHLHLSDDQGWRLAINAWPRLATVGGATEIGGSTGAYYYSQADYTALVAYARDRFVTVVPEFDMPAHTNAALVAYGELACNGRARTPFTMVGSPGVTLCVGASTTDTFVEQVLGEVSALAPGGYLHIGGDEAVSLTATQYQSFVQTAENAATDAHATVVAWAEAASAPLVPMAVAQYWDYRHPELAMMATAQGARVVMSPARHAYLDQKYDASSRYGLEWAGYVDERQAYEWDPATEVTGVNEADVLGVEGVLWTETVATREALDYMMFPRVIGHAEIGWSPAARTWDEYRARLGAQGPRLRGMGVGYYASSEIPWQ
jgi:hexosaminidase